MVSPAESRATIWPISSSFTLTGIVILALISSIVIAFMELRMRKT